MFLFQVLDLLMRVPHGAADIQERSQLFCILDVVHIIFFDDLLESNIVFSSAIALIVFP
jgi:hypothetical protein